jgi:hypothetical protein
VAEPFRNEMVPTGSTAKADVVDHNSRQIMIKILHPENFI